MCTERESLRVTYRVMRRHGKRLRPTGWKRTAPATRASWSRWQVYHNGRWVTLNHDREGWYIETR